MTTKVNGYLTDIQARCNDITDNAVEIIKVLNYQFDLNNTDAIVYFLKSIFIVVNDINSKL